MWIWLLAAALASFAQGSYVITAPRKWTYGTRTTVCTFHVGTTGRADEYLRLTIEDQENTTVASTVLPVTEGQKNGCYTVQLPELKRKPGEFFFIDGRITFEGRLGGKDIFDTRRLGLEHEAIQVFLQTDKSLYLPGQLVRLRLLTVQGPFARVSTENYRIVFVETPGGTRIRQWLNVDNTRGLVHLEFQLNQEADEGSYQITAKLNNGESQSQTFSVEDYVPPKFEVKVTSPKNIFATDSGGSVRVCANYTFGRPVKGRAVVTFSDSFRSFDFPFSSFSSSPFTGFPFTSTPLEVVKESPINGCQDFGFTFEEMTSDGNSNIPFQIPVTATVFEEGTDTEIEGSHLVPIDRSALIFERRSFDTLLFKPGLPLTVRVDVKKANDDKAAFEPMQVCLKELCKVIKTDSDGHLGFHVPPNAISPDSKHFENTIEITALNYPEIKKREGNISIVLQFESKYTEFFRQYYSPTSSSLLIQVPHGELDCREGGHQLYLDVMFSAYRQNKAIITVQVVSRGQIRYHHTAEYALRSSSLPLSYEFLAPMENPEDLVVGTLKIPVSLQETDSPEARVVVWYSRDDGEVVSDTATVDIQECLPNRVYMAWGTNQVQPGGRSTLTLAAEPNSICSFSVVDKSVELLPNLQFPRLNAEGIFNIITRHNIFFVNQQSDAQTYCAKQSGPIPLLPTEAPPTDFDNGPAGLGFSGRRKRSISFPREVFFRTVHEDALAEFDESGLFFITDLTIETRPCFREDIRVVAFDAGLHRPQNAPAFAGSAVGFGAAGGGGGAQQGEVTRTYFPETWLWDLAVIPYSGRSSGDFMLPDTITEWVGRTVCVHPNKGVGISDDTSIITFTPFFAEITLPVSVKRGEILPVKISVFNYLGQNLPVKVVLDSSPYFDILGNEEVVVPVGERYICVTSNEQETSIIRIKPKEIGNINMTARAFVDNSSPHQCEFRGTITKRDSLTKPIRVEAEGFPREKTWTKYVCSHELENNIDTLDIGRVDVPAGIVEGSERAFFTVSGDLLGPSFDNLDNLIRMPFGCGEQNLVLFAPNVFIMQYLEASQQITTEIAERSKRNMQRGYERQLKYRHRDGSYSAFGSSRNDFQISGDTSRDSEDTGSTWLTAFVIKSYSQARQYIFIDEDDLTLSIKWLEKQQMNNGCFRSVGKVFHKAMKGGVGTDSSDAPLTAYVLVAVLEAGTSPKVPAVERAITCLIQQHQTWSTYTRAMAGYALALAGHPDARTVLQQLLQEAKRSPNSISWETPAGLGKGVAVEIAGYAVLAMMTLDAAGFDAEAFKIIKWISSTRNGQGGFISTQDTVVALQALAAYSSTIKQGGTNLVVTIGATNLQRSFQLNDQNRILQQFVMLPTVPTSISLDMRGQGCALLQAVLRYNVPNPDPIDVFSLRVQTNTAADKKCITKSITACASYRLPDQKSNMAILEINLVSGYVPVKEDLKSVINGTELFKKYEVDGSKVMFYIDELTSNELCAVFKVTREVDIDNIKPGTVRVYDYYQPEFTIERSYVLPRKDDCIKLFEPSSQGPIN